MAKSFLTDINLNNNVLLNAKIQAWGSAPTGTTNPNGSGTAVAGQISSYLGALWIFNGTAWVAVGTGTVTSVTGTSPVVSSGGATPAISLASGYGDTLNPYASKTANFVLASPNGASGVPTFRALVAADIPTLNQNTTGSAGSVANALTIGTGLSGTSYNGSTAVTIAANAGSTSAAGILQLSDAINSTSTSLAATANAAKTAYDRGSTGITNAATAQSTADAALSRAGGTMTGFITTHADPTSDLHVANKRYVDTVSAGINVHEAVNVATRGALGTSGNLLGGTITTTYSNGTSGVGATLTIATSSNWTDITIDGQSISVTNRILIKDQAAALQNGIYTVTQVGGVGNTTSFIFTRALDNDQSPEIDAGDLTYVIAGTVNGGDGYVQTATGITVGTTSVTWTQFSGAGAVPLASVSSVGIASFPDAQFSVSGAGAVSIDNLGTLAGTFSTSGAFTLNLDATANTNVTLPTTGILATRAGSEALTNKTYNGLNISTSTGTLSISNGKALGVSNTITLAGTDSTTMTFPGTSATIARTDAGQTFTGVNTFTSPSITTSLTTGSTSFDLLNATATTINFAGAATTLNIISPTSVNSTINLGTGGGGSGQTKTINIGTGGTTGHSTTVNIANSTAGMTQNVNIGGASGNIITITGDVRVPSVGTSGFAKLGANGSLSAVTTVAQTEMATSTSTATATAAAATGNVTNARKAIGVGIGTGTAMVVNHGLGQWVTAQLYDTSGNQVEVDVLNASTSGGTTTFTFASSQTLTGFQYVIVG